MNRKYIFIGIIIFLLGFSCNKESMESKPVVYITEYSNLSSPSEEWIGKNLTISFGDKWPVYLKNLVVQVKIVEIKTDKDGYKYFLTEAPFSNKGHQELFFDWFDVSKNPHLLSWNEIK